LFDIIHPDSHPHCEQVFRHVLAGREALHIEAFFVTRQGQLIEVEGSAFPRVVDGRVVASHGFFRDITHRRQSEQRVLQAERLAAIGEVAAGVAHESRNALQRIQAHVDMLQLDFEDNPDVIHQLGRIGEAAEHISELLNEVRSYAAPIKLERVECCMANVWRQAWDNLAELRIGRDAKIVERIDDVATQCRLDPFRIEQVFRNLIENSLAACQDPLRVEISCTATYQENRRWLVVSFRDSGPGLSEEQKRRVFEAFYTTKTKGSGLGMAIAKRIVEAHGGSIDVATDDQPGAEFIVRVPCGNHPLP
jgi:signal transduction histidine kinase